VKVARARKYGHNFYIFLYEKFFTALYENQFLAMLLAPNTLIVDTEYCLCKYDNIYLFSTSKRSMLNRIYRSLLPLFCNVE